MAKRITMQDIADHLNVSKFVVSKALSGKGGVSEETRQKVIKAATQLGYSYRERKRTASITHEPDKGATLNSDEEKKTVLVMVPNHPYHQSYSHYWGGVLNGIATGLEQRNIGMMIVTNHNIDYFWQIINPQKLYGIIGVGKIPNHLLIELKKHAVPYVLIEHEDPLVPSDTLFTDNFECSKRLTDYLISIGHQRFQFVGNSHSSVSFLSRWRGFRASLEENQIAYAQNLALLSVTNKTGDVLTKEIDRILRTIVQDTTFPTAFICANDAIAMSTIEALQMNGKTVPDDCSVTGFDNVTEAASFEPAITTIHVEKEMLGLRAIDKLLWRLDHQSHPYEKWLLHGELIIRESTAAK